MREGYAGAPNGAGKSNTAHNVIFTSIDKRPYRKYFGKYAEKYHFKGAFDGMMHRWDSREEFWGAGAEPPQHPPMIGGTDITHYLLMTGKCAILRSIHKLTSKDFVYAP